MARVLVVEDSPTQAKEIGIRLEAEGFEVAIAVDGVAGMEALKKQLPDLVLTDLQMPRMNGLELVEAVRKNFPTVPVILMTAQGSEEIAVQALEKGAASYVPKRNLARDLVETLNAVLATARAGRSHERLTQCLAHSEMSFVLDNDCTLVPSLVDHLQSSITHNSVSDATEQVRIGIALEEALLHALYFGNLEIRDDLCMTDHDAYCKLVDQRLRTAPYKDRRIHVDGKLTPSAAVFVVRDEGPGYDPAALPNPKDPATLESVSGRGRLLIQAFMDEVRYNSSGNEITMIKRRDAHVLEVI